MSSICKMICNIRTTRSWTQKIFWKTENDFDLWVPFFCQCSIYTYTDRNRYSRLLFEWFMMILCVVHYYKNGLLSARNATENRNPCVYETMGICYRATRATWRIVDKDCFVVVEVWNIFEDGFWSGYARADVVTLVVRVHK